MIDVTCEKDGLCQDKICDILVLVFVSVTGAMLVRVGYFLCLQLHGQ